MYSVWSAFSLLHFIVLISLPFHPFSPLVHSSETKPKPKWIDIKIALLSHSTRHCLFGWWCCEGADENRINHFTGCWMYFVLTMKIARQERKLKGKTTRHYKSLCLELDSHSQCSLFSAFSSCFHFSTFPHSSNDRCNGSLVWSYIWVCLK